ncbi:hypothetical protein, partial [Dactylosporangium aurantiacum]|uniref:hypothetical protein n=1 Tax=Dactylosporangium aurantiacum TaxID=35754 RepID=UPI00138DD8B2
MDVHIVLERAADTPLTVTATVGDVVAEVPVAAGETAVSLQVRVPDVRLWWPRGYGAADLYDLTVELSAADGAL